MVNKDFFLALEDLEAEKGISQKVFIEALENALVIAYKRNSMYPQMVGEGITAVLSSPFDFVYECVSLLKNTIEQRTK